MTRTTFWGLLVPLLAGTAILTGCRLKGYEGDEPKECNDGADNDRNGAFDCDDPNCANAAVCLGTTETDTTTTDDGTDTGCDPDDRDADGDGMDDQWGYDPDDVEPGSLADRLRPHDCDDCQPLANPLLEESAYDGIDNDCDPTTPDDDLDEDGWLYVDDCDDQNPQANPGLTEVPYDGQDNDCDPDTPDDDDLDGDGYLLAEDCDDGDAEVVPDSVETCLGVHQAAMTLRGGVDDEYGETLAFADLDGDGSEEVVIGATGLSDNAGGIAIYAGEVLVGALVASEVYDQLGTVLSAAQDFDGDGRPDLLTSASGADPGGLTNVGEVYLLNSGTYGQWSAGGLISEQADAVFRGESSSDYLGKTVGSGDIDGDGLSELFIGSPGNDRAATDGGTVAIFSGAGLPDGIVAVASADGFLTGIYRDFLGELSTTVVDDLNGDGYPDIALGLDSSVGASEVDPGATWLLAGGALPTGDARSLAFAELHGLSDGDSLGSAFASGDLTGDGSAELFVSAPYADVVSLDAGGLYLFRGGPSLQGALTTDDAIQSWGGDIALESAGSSLRMADMDGDGVPDLLAASPYRENSGRAYILSGADNRDWTGGSLDDDATTWIVGAITGDGLGVGLSPTASGVAVSAPGVGDSEGAVYLFEL